MNTPTKKQIKTFLRNTFPTVQFNYSGRNKTVYLTGKEAKNAELGLLKTYGPGMLFKTESSETRPVQQLKAYYFTASGEFFHNELATGIIFKCKAKDNTNARRKFSNYIVSLTKAK